MTAGARLRIGACLSLSGRFAQFGVQAANGLKVWSELDGAADVFVEDDRSDQEAVEGALKSVAARCDVLLGPYSTQLVRRAARTAQASDWLLWNHGGSGDDVQASAPGHLLSSLTPTSRYAEPFVRRIAAEGVKRDLWIKHGPGRFGRQVAQGAANSAREAGIEAVLVGPDEAPEPTSTPWHLFVAGTFEDDVAVVQAAMDMPRPPQLVCSVAAGVRSFDGELGRDPTGTFGVGQWFPGATPAPLLGPDEATFVGVYAKAFGAMPDYPAAQAAGAAVIAAHATRLAGGTSRELVWRVATRLDTSTLFGAFAVDPVTGVQAKHEAALVRWGAAGLALASSQRQPDEAAPMRTRRPRDRAAGLRSGSGGSHPG
jgi:ABC-type branched-subunit amino acid transport system substrate-binding protein